MASFTKNKLSASTDGKAILIANTASAGTTIHTGSSNASVKEEIWLYAVNTDTTDKKITVEWGSNTSPTDFIEFVVKPENGLYLIVPGLMLVGNATTAPTVKVWANVANVVSIHGYIHTIA